MTKEQRAITTKQLSKTFKTRQGFWKRATKVTEAVRDVTFEVERGELFGLLGPNGAGKTTTVKMLATLLIPTGGKINIFGQDITQRTNEIRKQIGFTFGGARGLYGRLTAVENLRYFAELYALPPEVTRRKIPELLELVGLAARGNDKVETFSSGMQQRLHLARALIHDPELIYLDEPTVGIDPVGARELRATIKNLKAIGKTILLTTHYMAEADELCDRIAIINNGRIIALDTPSALKNRMTAETVVELKTSTENFPALKTLLDRLDPLTTVAYTQNAHEEAVSIHTLQPGTVMEMLSPWLNTDLIHSMEMRNQTLEDVYINIIQGDQE
ncbi:MAG TPA: ABC transporter ATP-binding protein [Anaerolineaceae bacterium]|nr:ABC transporter ATP-binding protein [Anaerolineaceae bacterium]